MDKYKTAIESFLEHGNAQSWKALQKSTRSKLINSAQKRGLIDKPHAHLLGWMLESTLTVADEAKVNELIAGMRAQLFDTLPAAKEEEAEIEIPEIPPLDPLHAIFTLLHAYSVLKKFSSASKLLESI